MKINVEFSLINQFRTERGIRMHKKRLFKSMFISLGLIFCAVNTISVVVQIGMENIVENHWLFGLGLVLVFNAVALTVLYFYTRGVTGPIEHIIETANQIAGGNLSTVPVQEHDQHEVGQLGRSINTMNENLRMMVDQIHEKTNQVKQLLNNAGQGFLSFGDDLQINEVYSTECIRIFGKEIVGVSFPELVLSTQAAEQTVMRNMLRSIFTESKSERQEVKLTLLLSEVTISERIISLDYRVIGDLESSEKQMMVIITDITDRRRLESQIEHDRSVLRMLIHVMTQTHDFDETINDFKKFSEQGIRQIIDSEMPMRYKLMEILRSTHTFKGNFSQMSMTNIANHLNELEISLNEFLSMEHASIDHVEAFLARQELMSWLRDDVGTIETILGSAFFARREHISIHVSRLQELREQIVQLLNPYETSKMLQAVDRLHYKPFKELLVSFPSYMNQIAQKLGKQVHPLDIQGGEFMVDLDEYYDFSRSLLHVLRNMIDHGIETPEERILAGKDEFGRVTLIVDRSGEWVEVTIIDDGRGLDFAKIRQQCVNRKIIEADQIDLIPNEAIIESVFIDGFTTRMVENEFSGHGMGLASVKGIVTKAGGMCGVKTDEGHGTTFVFHMPGPKSFHIEELEMDELLHPTVECSSALLEGSFGLNVNSVELEAVQSLRLRDYTSLLHIRGLVEGIFMLSVDQLAAEHMVRQYVVGSMSEEELQGYLLDVIGECSNLMMGGISHLRADSEEWLRMATPITTNAPGVELRYPDGQMWIATIETQFGPISLGFVVLNN